MDAAHAAHAVPAGRASNQPHAAERMRQAGPAELEAALTAGRAQLLTLFDGFEQALGHSGLHIAHDPVLNLPLWELGHIGWFEEHWIARNPQRALGIACDPQAPRGPSVLADLGADADALYESSNVPHARRWQLDLPSPDVTRDYLARVRASTLALLRYNAVKDSAAKDSAAKDSAASDSPASDSALYFHRLVLFHEDMHREAWHFMAQQLGIDLGPALQARAPLACNVHGQWHVPGGLRTLGSGTQGFAFDNELQASEQRVDAFTIDRAPVAWRAFLPFIDNGGYKTESLWTADGWAWRQRQPLSHPRHLRFHPGDGADGWQQHRFGRWHALDLDAPVIHVTAFEAQAWCRWAGRRLPSEAEWETAATLADGQHEAFGWGQVWEWTASPFAPYPGFSAHPYRDYSAPWFDGRPVLRGASFATTPHMRHPRFRNYFPADRNDVFAGFRSCALSSAP